MMKKPRSHLRLRGSFLFGTVSERCAHICATKWSKKGGALPDLECLDLVSECFLVVLHPELNVLTSMEPSSQPSKA